MVELCCDVFVYLLLGEVKLIVVVGVLFVCVCVLFGWFVVRGPRDRRPHRTRHST